MGWSLAVTHRAETCLGIRPHSTLQRSTDRLIKSDGAPRLARQSLKKRDPDLAAQLPQSLQTQPDA